MAARKLIAVRIDPMLCVGSGMCVSSHPEQFALQADGHARHLGAPPDEAAAREAEELCPVSAISLVYDEGSTP
jgi:ferredoxin